MSSPTNGGDGQQQQAGAPNPARSSSPLVFPSSSPARPAVQQQQQQQNRTHLAAPGQSGVRSSSPLAFPSSSSPRRGPAPQSQSTPQANRSPAVNPLFAPASAQRSANGAGRVAARNGGRGSSVAAGSDAPSSEPLFFPSSATPKARRSVARGDIHSSIPISPSPLRRRTTDGQGAAGPSSSAAPDGSVTGRERPAAGRGAAAARFGNQVAPSLSNVGMSSDRVEEEDRNQGARTVIWNTTVGLDETMSSFKAFLQDFKAKYRVEYARKQGKPIAEVADPEKLVYEG